MRPGRLGLGYLESAMTVLTQRGEAVDVTGLVLVARSVKGMAWNYRLPDGRYLSDSLLPTGMWFGTCETAWTLP